MSRTDLHLKSKQVFIVQRLVSLGTETKILFENQKDCSEWPGSAPADNVKKSYINNKLNCGEVSRSDKRQALYLLEKKLRPTSDLTKFLKAWISN